MPTEEEEEVYVRGIDQFLKGGEWVKVLHGFLDLHCKAFNDREEAGFLTEHFDIFDSFRLVADETFSRVLADLGCSEETFVSILEKYADTPPRGPTDAAIKDVYKTLLAFDDFRSFSELMAARYEELQAQEAYYNNHNHHGQEGVEWSHPPPPQEEKQPGEGRDGHHHHHHEEEAKGSARSSARWSLMTHQSSSFNDEDVEKLDEIKDMEVDIGLISPSASAIELLGAYDVEHPDWQAQLSMAEAILEGYHARSLPQDEEIFVPWAESVVEFTAAARAKEMGSKLNLLTARLLRERFRVDVVVAQRQAYRPVFSTMPQEEEAATAYLMEQNDTLRQEVADAKAEARLWLVAEDGSFPEGLTEEQLGRLYLLLKEKYLAAGEDGVVDLGITASDMVFDYMVESVNPTAQGVVTPLIRWLELERAKAAVSRVLTDKFAMQAKPRPEPSSRRPSIENSKINVGEVVHWVEKLDHNSGYLYYVDTWTGQSQWEIPVQEDYIRYVGDVAMEQSRKTDSQKRYMIEVTGQGGKVYRRPSLDLVIDNQIDVLHAAFGAPPATSPVAEGEEPPATPTPTTKTEKKEKEGEGETQFVAEDRALLKAAFNIAPPSTPKPRGAVTPTTKAAYLATSPGARSGREALSHKTKSAAEMLLNSDDADSPWGEEPSHSHFFPSSQPTQATTTPATTDGGSSSLGVVKKKPFQAPSITIPEEAHRAQTLGAMKVLGSFYHSNNSPRHHPSNEAKTPTRTPTQTQMAAALALSPSSLQYLRGATPRAVVSEGNSSHAMSSGTSSHKMKK